MQVEKSSKPFILQNWLPLLLAATTAVGMLVGYKMNNDTALIEISRYSDISEDTNSRGGAIEELIQYINGKYVDKIDSEQLTNEVITDMLNHLDPHSVYMNKTELVQATEDLDGEFDGIGIEFIIIEDTLSVVSVLSGGPSEQAGILPYDKFIAVNDSIIAGKKMGTDDMADKMRGKGGSKVKISLLRKGENKLKDINIIRGKIAIKSVDAAYMLNADCGYIKINRFSEHTYKEFMENLERLITQNKIKDLVIDVRQNPGGYLEEATKILSQLFPQKDKLLVYTKGRNNNKTEYKSSGKPFFDIRNIALLIDEGAASASEIMAGALQDWDRAVVVGRRSYGKGLVQEQFDLSNGGAVRLTVARYFTPSGRCIQRDYINDTDYNDEAENRYASGELLTGKNIPTDTTKYFTNNGRVVFGGGGITPDVFVAIDTALLNNTLLELRQYIPKFAFNYYNNNKSQFDKYTTPATFIQQYQVNETLLNVFVRYAQKQGAKTNVLISTSNRKNIATLLKAQFTRLQFKDVGYFMALNQNDPVLQAALKAIANPKILEKQATK